MVEDTAGAQMVPNWLPIETAPLDEDILLAWFETWPAPAWKIESGWAGRKNSCLGNASNGWLHGYATHWMPLPAPPAQILPNSGSRIVPQTAPDCPKPAVKESLTTGQPIEIQGSDGGRDRD